MELIKIKTMRELDDIIPMIKTLHEEQGLDKFFSLSGFLTWIAFNLPLENFQVWKVIDNDRLIGYCISQITTRYFELECSIVDAYMVINDPEFTQQAFEFIEKWGKEKGCTLLSCSSMRDMALQKKYGFEPVGMRLMKKIEGEII